MQQRHPHATDYMLQTTKRALFILLAIIIGVLNGCKDAAVAPQNSSTATQSALNTSSAAAPSQADTNSQNNVSPTTSALFDLRIKNLTPSTQIQQSKSHMRLQGSLRTSLSITTDQLLPVLKASTAINGKALNLNAQWEMLNETEYQFTLEDIPRQTNTAQLTLSWNNNSLKGNITGSKILDIPALNAFGVTSVRTEHLPKPRIDVDFSEPLDGRQDLNGLITLNGEVADARINGSTLWIYPNANHTGEITLIIQDTLRSSQQLTLADHYQQNLAFASEPPSVRFTHKGNTLPPNAQLAIPFEAINTRAVYVTAFKVFENNLHYYLQRNTTISNNNTDSTTGRFLWRKKIELPNAELNKKIHYAIDLNELMEKHHDGMINLSVSIDATTSLYPCANQQPGQADFENYDGPSNTTNKPSWYYEYYGSDNGYLSYSEQHNPCSASYYYYNSDKTQDARNLIVSDIGIIAKQGSDNNLHITATSINKATPLGGAAITVYNYQQQIIAQGKTNSDGQWQNTLEGVAYIVSVSKNNDTNFLVVARNQALPTSQFDIGGEVVNNGLKGFLYGERDLWRPGDDVYLSFILQDEQKKLPPNYPVTLDFFDPRGTKISSQTQTKATGNIYTFNLSTQEDSPTGAWRAVARVGNQYFDLPIKIETFIPNRLKIDINAGATPLTVQDKPTPVTLSAQWLNGTTAKQLKADVDVKVRPKKTTFEGLSQYTFDDPASEFKQQQFMAFEGKLNDVGTVDFPLDLTPQNKAPGSLRATLITRVFEQSGNFSTAIRTLDYLPFKEWVGIQIAAGNGYRGAIDQDATHPVELISINDQGKPLANQEIDIAVYSLGWRWWWDQSNDEIANYVQGSHNKAITQETLTTNAKGKASWMLAKGKYTWGRHLVRACKKNNGHCTGQIVYLGWSNTQNAGNAATELVLETDKNEYQVGDTAIVSLPASIQGQVLYSLETGSKILREQWQTISANEHALHIPITQDMAPNVYVNVSLLLPHANKTSDAPIRLYGISPLKVKNPATHLNPIIEAPQKTRPQSSFTLNVSEEQGRAMHYTLALVDEGLLGVTGFSTPNPHAYFFKREALGVQTWDMFDSVVGAYGANLERLLHIGGSDAGTVKQNKHERRFKPVVQFIGAFSLAEGQKQEHKITLPAYMGAVRIMLVAAQDNAFGAAEKTISVSQPLTLLTTLPRVIGPQESLNMPVNVFANDESIKDVTIKVEADDIFTFETKTLTHTFTQTGDAIVQFPLLVKDRLGKGKIIVTATSGDEIAQETIYLESRSPNLPSTQSTDKLLQPGELWAPTLGAHGIDGTNTAKITAGILPPLNLEQRLQYLIRYPHGCLEQTTSAIFPQILLNQLMPLDDAQKNDIQHNVEAAITKYHRFQIADGSFTYWPGTAYVNPWANTYATHFLINAQAQGYPVATDLINNALAYLKTSSQQADNALILAYQLYVLAAAKQPELASMNRLREQLLLKNNTHFDANIARWLLASAYQLVGVNDAAEELFNATANTVNHYNYSNYHYGSELRDLSLLLLTQNTLGYKKESWQSAQKIAQSLNKDTWYSTQSTAFALIALADYSKYKDITKGFKISINEDGNLWQTLNISDTLQQVKLQNPLQENQLQIRNDGEQEIYVQVSNTGVELGGNETANANGLTLDIIFTDLTGNDLAVNRLPQGQDFIANITVSTNNPNSTYQLEDLAMTFMLPSGWQIRNERLEGDSQPKNLDFQDIRDDKVQSYFSLWRDYEWWYRYNDSNREKVTIQIVLNATYAGKFYLPGSAVKAMYDEGTYANSKGMWVDVIAQ